MNELLIFESECYTAEDRKTKRMAPRCALEYIIYNILPASFLSLITVYKNSDFERYTAIWQNRKFYVMQLT